MCNHEPKGKYKKIKETTVEADSDPLTLDGEDRNGEKWAARTAAAFRFRTWPTGPAQGEDRPVRLGL